jgi:hypothetical protein
VRRRAAGGETAQLVPLDREREPALT